MSGISDSVIVRKAGLGDIGELSDFYLGLPLNVKRFFHPIPFDKTKVVIIFLIMIMSGKIINMIKILIPHLAFLVLVANDAAGTRIKGFVLLSILGREHGKLIANCGGVTREGEERKGIGTDMYAALVENAKVLGIGKFRITVLQKNTASLSFHKKFGFVDKGYTTVDFWEDKCEKNILLELDLK